MVDPERRSDAPERAGITRRRFFGVASGATAGALGLTLLPATITSEQIQIPPLSLINREQRQSITDVPSRTTAEGWFDPRSLNSKFTLLLRGTSAIAPRFEAARLVTDTFSPNPMAYLVDGNGQVRIDIELINELRKGISLRPAPGVPIRAFMPSHVAAQELTDEEELPEDSSVPVEQDSPEQPSTQPSQAELPGMPQPEQVSIQEASARNPEIALLRQFALGLQAYENPTLTASMEEKMMLMSDSDDPELLAYHQCAPTVAAASLASAACVASRILPICALAAGLWIQVHQQCQPHR